eukprot:9281573-Pyramimonas_sp.AAC.1
MGTYPRLLRLIGPSWEHTHASCVRLVHHGSIPAGGRRVEAQHHVVRVNGRPLRAPQQHPAAAHLRTTVDVKGSTVDSKGSTVDVKGYTVDGKGSTVDGKGSIVDGKGSIVDVKGSTVDNKGSTVDNKGSTVDSKGSTVDVKGSTVDVKGSTTESPRCCPPAHNSGC